MTRTSLIVGAAIVVIVGAGIYLRSERSRTGPDASTSHTPGTLQPVSEIARASRPAAPVIFLGLDGADWQLLDRYISAGTMPNLKQLVAEGTTGSLETLHPALSPLVWTSMMTGVDPLQHGVLDFVRYRPGTDTKEPITSDERKAPAIWNMASWADRRVAVFGLWSTYPAEPVNGLMVSDRLFTFLFREAQPPEGVVYPREHDTWARTIVERSEAAIDAGALREYLPWLTDEAYKRALESETPYGNPISALRRTLVETRIYDDLASDWIETQRPDLAVVYFQGTDSIGHTFAPFAPPRQPSISDEDFDRYSRVPEQYFASIDRLLGRYRALATKLGAVLMLASDHGFTWIDDRPTELSSNANQTAAKWHRKQGMYLLWGAGIKPENRRLEGGSVLQVCATLLALAGLPPGKGLASPALPGAPSASAGLVDYGPHYQRPAPVAGTAATRKIDDDTLARLRALGYIGAAESSSGRRIDATRSAGSYNNEGLILREKGRRDEAIRAFESALVVDPRLASAMWNLSDMLFDKSADLDRSDLLLVQAFGARLPEGTKYLVGRAIGYQRSGRIDRAMKLLEAALRLRPEEPEVWLFSGRYRVERGDCVGGVSDIEKAVRLTPTNASAHASLGVARLCSGDRDAARTALLRSLELDPSQPAVRDYVKKLGGR
jgi:tetratricopeptide (TPR) repeat protein